MSAHEEDNSTMCRRTVRSESGQTTSEYAVVLVFLVPTCVLVFTGLGGSVTNLVISVARLLP
jgi:Flp pilus assembly pilin Flp